jgi:hypothetical protein
LQRYPILEEDRNGVDDSVKMKRKCTVENRVTVCLI